ncbi:hypothetical protein B0I08_103172 [Glaciihabitans tibetensis]|uniref:DUF1684 domain-containing protein n=1 Tax=Glaciihabitans tibetensis TaxID=1266600 RepID=A0A2T0VFM0_9MICO|nr:DUF1684 domain-containing protein [Glaciihabitans tibetensis]PRY68966.1 hypothetical protein B0I08_103172 [Glaciihabitans tibetensis]
MTSPSLVSPRADALSAFANWRTARRRAVTSATGNLSLVETRWLPAGVDPAEELARATAEAAATVTVTSLSRSNLDTGEPEYGLRFWDAASPAIAAFDEISAFEYNADWVIEAQFTPISGDRTIPFEHIRDNGGSRELVVPGDITFTRDGVDYSLSAFDDDGTLLLVFGDTTNRLSGDSSTYSSGRFLFVRRADEHGEGAGAGFGEAGPVILDFNRAFVPPCGFSVQYNCPLPPAQNRFAVPVDAGERHVVFTGDFDIYSL